MLAIIVADELAQAGQRIKRLEEELVAIADRNKTAQTAIAAAAERVENVTKALNQKLASNGITLG